MNSIAWNRTQTYLSAALTLIAVFAAAFIWLPAFAGLKIDVCHATRSNSNPYVTVNVNINSVEDAQNVGGHGTHQADAWNSYIYEGVTYPGQGDMNLCAPPPTPTATPTEDPTDEPQPSPYPDVSATPTPTEEPGPSPTPTEPEGQPTPTPLATNIEPTSTSPPPVTPELPSTGDGHAETWLCWGTNVYCSHNGVDGSEGENWVFAYQGATITIAGTIYVVQDVQRVAYNQVGVLNLAGDYDAVAITCTNYVNDVWLERIVIFANLSQ